MAALVGSISYRTYRPRILGRSRKADRIPRPSEGEKHRLLMELFGRIDEMQKEELSPAAAYFLKKVRKGGTSVLYEKAEDVFDQLEERMNHNPSGIESLNSTGLYRTAVRLALVGIAQDRIADLKSEVLSWGFTQVAPIADTGLDIEPEAPRVSGMAMPISR
jgi:hypothetical protein